MASDYKKIGGAWQGDKGISFKLEGWPGYAYLFVNTHKQPGDKKPDFDICVKESVMPDVAAQYMSDYDRRQASQSDGQSDGQSQEPAQTPEGNVRAAFEMDSSVPF